MDDFNFDDWANLYRRSPVEFEQRRKEVIYSEIAKAPAEYRNKLHLLQAECDALSYSLPPLDAASEISKLMMGKVLNLQGSLLDLGTACKEYNNIRKTKDSNL